MIDVVVPASAGHGPAAEVLRDLGVSRERILATTCMRPRPDDGRRGQDCMSVMPRFKQALEHEILRRLKVSPDAVRGALAERLGVEPQRLGRPAAGAGGS